MKIIECNLPRNGNFTRRSKTDEVILHHAEASSATVEQVNQWHLDKGWTGIGYHYYIRKDGSIYRGRPEWAMGAHAVGHNDRSIGICCEGAYMTETMPTAQLVSLKELLRDIMGRYGTMSLKRHRDVNSTNCPGDNFPWEQAQQYMQEEDDEVVEKKTVLVDGKEYTCECIEKDGHNFVKMRSLSQAGYDVVFDAARQLPAMTAPQCRAFVPDGDEAVQDAIDTLQETCGLEEQTIAYMRKYKYGDDLVKKLAKAVQGNA